MVDRSPTFGACIPTVSHAAFSDAGWDFIEVVVDDLLATEGRAVRTVESIPPQSFSAPIRAANRLVPPNLKVVGPEVSQSRLQEHLKHVTQVARQVGLELLVFGSGAARMVPTGFDRETARGQLLDFCNIATEMCASSELTLVLEPLNRQECNIINSVSEAMTYVAEIDHPSFRCLVDSYHLWLENEPLQHVVDAMPFIHHVHLADARERKAPGATGENDYRPLFAILQRGGYHGMITVESSRLEDEPDGARQTLAFLKQQWLAAADFALEEIED